MTLPGVDVSSFQGPPSTWLPIAGHIDWAAVKLTELEADGTRYVNPEAAADWRTLGSAKKGRVAYTFGHPSTSAAGTVAFFTGELAKIGFTDRDAVGLDLEVTNGRSPAEVAAWGREVLAELHRVLDRTPLIYTFISFAQEGNCAGMGHYPLWIADPSSPRGHPRVPEPWHTWAAHQYETTGRIDRDVANYRTLAAMTAALGKTPKKEAKVIEHTTAGHQSLAGLADQHDCQPSTILRLTAHHSPGGVYPGNVAAYINGVFRGRISHTDHMPAGLHLYLPQ